MRKLQKVEFGTLEEDSENSAEPLPIEHKLQHNKYRRIYLLTFILLIICAFTFGVLETKRRFHELRQEMIQKAAEEKRQFIINFAINKTSHSPYRPVILFAYSENPLARNNTLFFINHGLHAEADFIFIINGDSDIDKHIPKNLSNIRIIKRENTCFDLGSMGEVLKANNNELVSKYKRFILMNSSIRGPFLPTWSKDCWSDLFLNRLSDEVKLVGMTFNCFPQKHIQSMIIATDYIGIQILLAGDTAHEKVFINEWGFNPYSQVGLSGCAKNYGDAVSAEISLTNLIYENNYKPEVVMTAAKRPGYYDEFCDNDSVLHLNTYFGTTLHPYESVFAKVSRNIYDEVLLEKLTEWHDDWNYSSWEACLASTM
jgi:hypothetical protein